MVITILERVMPTVVKQVGKKGAIELIVTAGLVGGVTEKVYDATLGKVVDIGVSKVKSKVAEFGEKRKAELEAKKAMMLAQQQQTTIVETVEIPEEYIEEKDNTSGKKKHKN